jgi:hypothetical protein
MLPKFAETSNPQRLGVIANRATDIDDLTKSLEKGTQGIGDKQMKQIRMMMGYTSEITRARDQAKAKFDKEANEKDLVGRDRRGIEASMEYQLRREAGIPPKNERDDDKSPYSLRNIEQGLMTREAIEGIEYAAVYDKDGELISVYKGEKGTVGVYVDSGTGKTPNANAPVEGGTLTHSHPTDGAGRPFGMILSAGDIKVHAARRLAETRAVAREGTYSMKANIDEVRIPQDMLDSMPRDLRDVYNSASPRAKGEMAMRVLANISETGSQTNPLQRAGNEVGAAYARIGVTGAQAMVAVQNNKEFLSRQVGYQRALMEKFGIKYEFKPNAGYEDIAARGEEIAKGFNLRGHIIGMTDPINPQQLSSEGGRGLQSRPLPTPKPSIIDRQGKRDDAVLSQSRTPPPRTAPPPASAAKVTSAPKVKEAGGVKSAPKARSAPKTPKEAPPIKAAPKASPTNVDPPTSKTLDDFFKRVGAQQKSFGGLGGLRTRAPQLPPEIFGS